MGFMQGKMGRDNHYYEERMHSSGQTFVVRDGKEIVSGLTSDPGYSAKYMDSLGGFNVKNPRENSDGGESFFDSLSNFSFGGSSDNKGNTSKSWLDF